MSRILLADDSPHAQRMGERILREEGFEVVTVTDGETAMIRLADVDPDIVMADVFLPHKSGYDICRYVKSHPKHRHARVILLAGLLEPLDESEAARASADAVLKKPFEASAVIETVKPLAEAAAAAREAAPPVDAAAGPEPAPAVPPQPAPAPKPEPLHADPDRVRAAVTLALDQATPALIEEITARVLIALGH
jgi:CheY-like chemotaxis protein